MSMFLPVRERIDNLYKFNNPQLLLQSVTHMSWLNEQMGADLSLDNQRLEFLGDAALKAMQARILFEKYPTWDEGRLTKTRAGAENNRNLAVWCRYLGLDTAIKVGHGMSRDPSRAWDGICAQVFEAFLGAIWQDCGYDLSVLYDVYIRMNLPPVVDDDGQVEAEIANPKGRLQELVQKISKTGCASGNPEYTDLERTGPSHRPEFRVQLRLPMINGGNDVVVGVGLSKRLAQGDAATQMLAKFPALVAQHMGTSVANSVMEH